MSDEEQQRERGWVMEEYVKAQKLLATLVSRRKHVGETLRELAAVFLRGERPAPEIDWALLADPGALRELLREIDDAEARRNDLRGRLRGFGLPVAD